MLHALICLSLAAAPPLLPAQETAPATSEATLSPTQQVQALVAEFRKAQDAFFEAYRAAEGEEAQEKLRAELLPDPLKWAPRFLELAEKFPDDPAAVQALSWVVATCYGELVDKALRILAERYATAPGLESVFFRLRYSSSPLALDFLAKVAAEHPQRESRAQACYSLALLETRLGRLLGEYGAEDLGRHIGDQEARVLLGMDGKALRQKGEARLEQVVKEFGDLPLDGVSLGEQATGDLFELRNLVRGKPAPEIAGEDVDGRPMKLSDFRGQVVVLDFWGFW